MVRDEHKRRLLESGLFDEDWYLARYPDVRLSKMDPAEHYLSIGARLNRCSSAAAEELRTKNINASIGSARETICQVLHETVATALAEARAQRADERIQLTNEIDWEEAVFLLNRKWIEKQGLRSCDISLECLLNDPKWRAIDPHPLFSVDFYLQSAPDAVSTLHPLEHYLRVGWQLGIDPHPLFCGDWYRAQQAAKLSIGIPLIHYLLVGWRIGLQPNPIFSPRDYIQEYPDVAAAGIEPLTHYVMHGRAEGREPYGIRRLADLEDIEWKHAWGPMGYLLRCDPPVSNIVSDEDRPQITIDVSSQWPPKPINDYWLPQRLRDFIISGYGEDAVNIYWYLCSVMSSYQGREDAFACSIDCAELVSRLKWLANRGEAEVAGPKNSTIIVPVYNNVLDTLLCLITVFEAAGEMPFDVIVADDSSTDQTGTLLSDIGGRVNYFRHAKNIGFLRNCNDAARRANTEILVFLNNDTLVMPGWLDELLKPFSSFEKVGLVGSKLVSWDGTLQEAGGIYWQDGSAWNYGRNQDARDPQFNYVKDVDYCSGASIAVPKDIWDRLGGFDLRYLPAYCEDADLAFQIRAIGYRVLYQPFSEVVHHEGRSHGRDLAAGIKAFQVANQRKLAERWREVLKRDNYPNGVNALRARDRSRLKRHVLIIDHYIPQWDRDAGSRSTYQIAKQYQELGFVVTFWPDNLWYDSRYAPDMQRSGIEVIYGHAYQGQFETMLQERADLYDVCFLNRPHISERYVDAIRRNSRARVIYYGHDLHYRRMELQHEITKSVDPREIMNMRSLEIDICKKSDVIFYPDSSEVAIIEREVTSDQRVLKNPVYVFDRQQLDLGRKHSEDIQGNRKHSLLFVGGFAHPPNEDGIIWFVREVLPLVRLELPDALLTVVGAKPPDSVRSLEGSNVKIMGFVTEDKLDKLYQETALAIAPLRFGGGVKGKVLEAMAKGVPMATTSIGAQGVDIREKGLFLGDSPDEFAEAVIWGLKDRVEAAKRVRASLEFISQTHSTEYLGVLLMSASLS